MAGEKAQRGRGSFPFCVTGVAEKRGAPFINAAAENENPRNKKSSLSHLLTAPWPRGANYGALYPARAARGLQQAPFCQI
nr:MAG TPA: hypothetical protein [Caudoviricetes sp.]